MLMNIFVKIEVHEHASRGQDDTLLVPQRPNSSALFTDCEDILERLKAHLAPQDEGDKFRKSFLLYGMGGTVPFHSIRQSCVTPIFFDPGFNLFSIYPIFGISQKCKKVM
jgi:hypothetical protein